MSNYGNFALRPSRKFNKTKLLAFGILFATVQVEVVMVTKKQAAKTAKTEAVAVAAQAEQTKQAAKPEAPATLYVVGPKATKPGTFFARVQALASQPTTLAAIVAGLQAAHKDAEGKGIVPKSKKDHDMVIRVRCNYATTHQILVPAPTK